MGESKTTALELGFNPRQKELVQDTENVRHSNRRNGKSQVLGVILMAASSSEGTAESPSIESPDPQGIVEWVRNIYADGAWNATPDIAHWQGNYYVVVNQGNVHPGHDGPGMVLRSSNLQEWEQIYTTSGSAVDCKLLALPDRLMFYYLYWELGEDRNYVETRVVYTEDGQSWSEPQRVHEPLHNFWRPRVHDGVIYVASDTLNIGRSDYQTPAEEANPDLYRVDLLRSTDGLAWEKVSTIVAGKGRGQWGSGVTETEIVFRPDGELWALVRQNILARACPPYLDWTIWTAGTGKIGGPAMICIGNDLYAGGRFYGLPNNKDGKHPQVTSLWKYDEAAERLERIADLPKAAYADCSYPGFVATEDGVYVVYYSGHTYGETAEARSTKADIYLAKLNIGRDDLQP